jgi:membrane fusion protein, multidrug efflux system
MSGRMVIMLLLSAVLFGGVFGMKWFGTKKMNEFLDAMPAPAVTISSAKAEAMTWESRLASVGSLVAVNGADLTAEVDGVVTNIYFDSGDTVKRGELLLSMASASEQGELKRLQAQAELTELNRKRSEQLYERKTISKSEYDTAVAETNVALAAVQAQKGRLEQKSVKAPFDGQLGIRRVNVGQYLGVGVAIATLQKLDPIDVDFSIPERYLSILAPGLKISVTVDAYGDKTYEGEVLAIEPKVNPQTRNVDVRARLPNPEGKLKPGLFATVVVSLPNSSDVTVIPRSAVNYTSYGDSVFLIQKNPDALPPPAEPNPMMGPYTDLEVIQRFVTLGDARGDYIAVSKGLELGDELASSGLLKLRNKQPVIIDNSNALSPELNPQPPQG